MSRWLGPFLILLATSLAVYAADEPKAKPANLFDRAIQKISQEAKTVAHAARQAGQDIGRAASKAAKEVASPFKKTGKEDKGDPKAGSGTELEAVCIVQSKTALNRRWKCSVLS
jgi:hypothetical protein